jgi:hypothetical protein
MHVVIEGNREVEREAATRVAESDDLRNKDM